MSHPFRLTLLAAALALAACAAPSTAPHSAQIAQGVPGMDAGPLYKLGRYLHGQQKFDAALRAYEQVLAIEPDHVDALTAVGVIRSLRGEAGLAEAALRKAVALAPDSARGYNNLGYHLLRTGKASEALTQLARAQALAPRDEQVQVNIAQARQQLAPVAAVAAREGAPAIAAVAPRSEQPADPAVTVELRRVNEGVWELKNAPTAPSVAAVEAAPSAPTPAAAAAAAPAAKVRVEFSNGNGAAGLAREVSRLAAPGARLTNNRPFGTVKSRVEYVAGAEQAARDVEARLPYAVPLAPVARLDRAGVRVLLGKDFPSRPTALARAAEDRQRIALTTTPQP